MPLPNLYSLGNLPNTTDPQTRRVFQDLVDQLNYLTGEIGRLKERDLSILPSMSAKKENPIEGIITIPSLGGDGSIRVSKDGVIVSYVNPGNMLGVARVIPPILTVGVGNTGADPSSLQQYTLQPDVLAKDGDVLEVIQCGTFAANATQKAIWLRLNGTDYSNHQFALLNSEGWCAQTIIHRNNATQVRVNHMLMANRINIQTDTTFTTSNLGGAFDAGCMDLTVNNLNTTTNILEGMGWGNGANNNVFQFFTIVRLIKMS